jgi:hypothetical protein
MHRRPVPHMKKLALFLSVVAVSFALQAGEGTCPKDKGACDKAGTCEKAKAGSCDLYWKKWT